jgi:putative IMPACT (imprinted ancient) family translation regulator
LEVKDTTIPSNLRRKKYYIKKKIVNFSVLPIPIQSEDEVKLIIDGLRKKHPNAGHFLCLSNRHRHPSYRANDDGEPSNSAGMLMDKYFLLSQTLVVVAKFLAALN